MASAEVVVGPLPMRGWYFVPPVVVLVVVGGILASGVRGYADAPGAPSRREKATLAKASGLFTMAVGASFVWLFVLGSSRRRAVTLRIGADAIVVVDAGAERTIAREPAADTVIVRRVPQYVEAPPRWCLAYGGAGAPLVVFTTFDGRELEPHAAAVSGALASVPPRT